MLRLCSAPPSSPPAVSCQTFPPCAPRSSRSLAVCSLSSVYRCALLVAIVRRPVPGEGLRCCVCAYLRASGATHSSWDYIPVASVFYGAIGVCGRCAEDMRCSLEPSGECVASVEKYINGSWTHLLTSTDVTSRACKVLCCLAIWLIITYTLTQVGGP